MRRTDLEAKVLALVDRVQRKQPIEDSLVELKAEWIEPSKAARRIAAACNAARGEPVLFVFGLDEEKGVCGATKEEFAEWWHRVQAEIDQLAPSLIHDVAVPVNDLTVVALYFDSEAAPFVVKNPVRNQPGAGPTELEVPWRDGTRTRSAPREDLIRILVPATRVPSIEVVSARAVSRPSGLGINDWSIEVACDLYVVARHQTVLVAHRSSVVIDPSQLGFVGTRCRRSFGGSSPEGVAITEHDVVLSRPAMISLIAAGRTSSIGPILPQRMTVHCKIGSIDDLAIPEFEVTLAQVRSNTNEVEWQSMR